MHHYVYRITDLENNKYYYGTRSSKITPKFDIGCKYFSSSRDKDFISKQKENPLKFKYKVVKIFNTRKEAISLEIKLHDKFNVGINENFYNRSKQTSTGWDTTGIPNPMREETKIKLSIANKGKKLSKETKEKNINKK